MQLFTNQTMSSSKQDRRKPDLYPPPLIVQPSLRNIHTNTIILLHGRGSNAETFAPPLLSTVLSSGQTFQQSLSNTKFVFPTASFRRATFANRTPITQWFNSYSLDDLEAKPEYEIEGLRGSTRYLHGLIKSEIEAVGIENVVVGGLSLGACLSLVGVLTWGGERLSCCFGMAGRLPLRKLLVDAMDGGKAISHENDDTEIDFFETEVLGEDAANTETISPGLLAVRALKEELDLDLVSGPVTTVCKTPIFLGHGVQDEKVPVVSGRLAVECLRSMGCDVTWREYEPLGHWYHQQELDDIMCFLKQNCKSIAEAAMMKQEEQATCGQTG